jgi:succinate-acetate transporter protein
VIVEAMTWAPYVASWLQGLRQPRLPVYELFWVVREVVAAGMLLVLVHAILHEATEPLPDPGTATTWLKRAEASVLVRIVAAIAFAIVGIGIGVFQSPAAIQLVIVGGPLIAALAVLGLAWSLLSVERANLVEMPRVRLLLGAAITAWSAGVQLLQGVMAYRLLNDDGARGQYGDHASLWKVAAPAISIAGIVLVCSAISRFARHRGNEPLRQTAMARGILYATLMGIVVLVPVAMNAVSSTSELAAISLILAVCAIFSLVMLAGLLRRTATAIGAAPALPTALLRR